MIEADLEVLVREYAGLAFLVFLRIGAAFFFLPILGSSSVSVRVRIFLCVACVLLIFPLVVEGFDAELAPSDFVLAAFAEVFTGLLLGFVVQGFFWIVIVAGSMAAQAISLSQILGNQVDQPQPAMGQIIFVGALALATILDFHVTVVIALAESYQVVPLGAAVPDELLSLWSVEAVSSLFRIAFGLAGPFLVLAVLYNLFLGVVNKAMPQLMVAFVGAPAITWLGLVFMLLAAPVMLATWSQHLIDLSLLQGLP